MVRTLFPAGASFAGTLRHLSLLVKRACDARAILHYVPTTHELAPGRSFPITGGQATHEP
jgi:hypothetical protein